MPNGGAPPALREGCNPGAPREQLAGEQISDIGRPSDRSPARPLPLLLRLHPGPAARPGSASGAGTDSHPDMQTMLKD